MEISVFYKDTLVIKGFPRTAGDEEGDIILRPQEQDNKLTMILRTVNDPVLGNNCPDYIPDEHLTGSKDRCTLGVFINNLIERAELDIRVIIAFQGSNAGSIKSLQVEARLFRGYWDQVCCSCF